ADEGPDGAGAVDKSHEGNDATDQAFQLDSFDIPSDPSAGPVTMWDIGFGILWEDEDRGDMPVPITKTVDTLIKLLNPRSRLTDFADCVLYPTVSAYLELRFGYDLRHEDYLDWYNDCTYVQDFRKFVRDRFKRFDDAQLATCLDWAKKRLAREVEAGAKVEGLRHRKFLYRFRFKAIFEKLNFVTVVPSSLHARASKSSLGKSGNATPTGSPGSGDPESPSRQLLSGDAHGNRLSPVRQSRFQMASLPLRMSPAKKAKTSSVPALGGGKVSAVSPPPQSPSSSPVSTLTQEGWKAASAPPIS
ncbi:hypothetical protein BJ508DRAFT_337140, partial [Ascobolus immersus RN42]